MPVTRLLVEGKLEVNLFKTLLGGLVDVVKAGSKNSMAPRARTEREQGNLGIAYLRDRDFDCDPPAEQSRPAVDQTDKNTVLGWHWCRHEIENYLIDPDLVGAVFGWAIVEYTAALLAAGRQLRHYQAARWAIGRARCHLPPYYDLETKPPECAKHEFRLPADLGQTAVAQWAHRHIADFCDRIQQALAPTVVEAAMQERQDQFTDLFLDSVPNLLVWFSGKDLLAALEPWLKSKGLANAGDFRASLRDWIVGHPDEALHHLPEWQGLRDLLQS